MSFEFHLNPNLRAEVNKAVEDTMHRLKGSDFQITNSLHAIFVCDGSVVQVTFTSDGEQVGERLSFSRSEASDLGQRTMESGTWNEFPFSGIPVGVLRAFGQRLRDYGNNGC